VPITKLKDEEEILRRLGHANPIRYPASQVINEFHARTRAKQIKAAEEGHKVLREKIGAKAGRLEEGNRLRYTCFFSMPKGEMILLGILASYYYRGQGNLLWWEPEKGDQDD